MSNGNGRKATLASGDSRRQRWWCDIRWIAAGVVIFSITPLLWLLFGPEPAIRVSRETTFITGPLADDGLPDYPAAVLAMAGPAPPPEENAAALILQTVVPRWIKQPDIPVVCAALGIPTALPGPLLQGPGPFGDSVATISHEAFSAAQETPWTGADLPELAAWLIANERLVDNLVCRG